METELRKACSDCRFSDSDDYRCFHEASKSQNATGSFQWKSCEEMRAGVRFDNGRCGYDAKLFEAPLPLTWEQVATRLAIPVMMLLCIVGCVISVQPH